MMFHLKKTVNADMASLVQEQLLDISIVYQLLEKQNLKTTHL